MAQASNPSERRGPSLLDACVFIAAIGLGLALLKTEAWGTARSRWFFSHRNFKEIFQLRFAVAVIYATPFLFCLSAAVSALSLRPHRGGRKNGLLRPGVAACFTVVVSTTLYLVVNTARKLFYGTKYAYDQVGRSWGDILCDGLLDMASHAGYLVAALWVLQAVVGGGSGRSSWIDKLGRAIGVIWLVFLFSPPLKPAF